MEINLYNVKTNFCKIIQSLIDGEEESIIITKNGKPVVQMIPIAKKNSKRVGIAKKEFENFSITVDELDSIPVLDFFGDEL